MSPRSLKISTANPWMTEGKENKSHTDKSFQRIKEIEKKKQDQ